MSTEANTGDMEFECPGCGESIEVEHIGDPNDDEGGCPVCFGIFPMDEWIK